jgi:signal transduction histidine kinase
MKISGSTTKMRRFQTLKIKLILPVLFILIIVFLGSSFLIIDREYNAAKESFINYAESFSILSVERLIENYITYYDSGFYIYTEFVDGLMSLDIDVESIQIVDVNGNILFDSSEIEEGKYNLRKQEDRILSSEDLIERAGLSTATKVIDENKRIVDIIQPYIIYTGAHYNSVRYQFSFSSLDEMTQGMIFTISIYSAIFMILSFLLIFILFNRLISSPVSKLIKGVRKMSEGQLGHEIRLKTEDELGELASAFNSMSLALKDTQDQLKDYSKNLEKQVDERTKELEEKNKYLKQINKDLTIARENLNTLNKNLEKIIKQRTEEVEDLLRQKDEFINQMGHDLKTPLMPLTTLIPLLEQKEKDPKKKGWFEVLNRNVDYMKSLVVKTLELAKLNSPKTKFSLEKLSLKDAVERIIKNNETILETKKIKLENKISNKYIINADKLRLEELFSNIIENSVKYNKENGKIVIDAEKDKNFVKISVKDTGIGMSSEQIRLIFDEFYKADKSRHDFDSSGLGLSICKRIVEKHDGKIWAESPGPGKGTTIFFTLPLVKN